MARAVPAPCPSRGRTEDDKQAEGFSSTGLQQLECQLLKRCEGETVSSGNVVSLKEHLGSLPQQGATESPLACRVDRKGVLLPDLALA